jgi:glycosyltransferase involved in cell wall biosynthesis
MTDVCLLTNVPSPYRLPIFERINEECSLTVIFYEQSNPDRRWETNLNKYDFYYEFLDQIKIGPVHIPINALSKVRGKEYDLHIVGEGPPYLPTIMTVIYDSLQRQIPFILWTEGVDVTREHESIISDIPSIIARKMYDIPIRRAIYAYANGYIALSGEMTQKFLQRRGCPTDNIIVGHQVMPKSILPPGTSDKKENSNKKTIFTISYLEKRKGIDTLINSYEDIRESDTELVIAGSGPDKDRLKRSSAHMDDVHFLGYVSEDKKWQLYRQADIFVLPTYIDTWGLVINEAMYFGTPIITTEAAGASQIVRKESCGLIVPPGNVAQLSKSIEKILSDKELYKRFANNARNATDAWSTESGAAPFLQSIERFAKE